MNEITFSIEACHETGGYVARWDAPGGGGITTQGDSFGELQAMVADAVEGYFDAGQRPAQVRLHFVEDPVLALIESAHEDHRTGVGGYASQPVRAGLPL